jgi:hypothetical protein
MESRENSAAGSWAERERYWSQKLGRLRLGVEPIEQQLAKYRRVTWALTAVPVVMGLMFVTLFSAFGAPKIGLAIGSALVVGVAGLAWLDYWRMARRASAYERERRDFEAGSTGAG